MQFRTKEELIARIDELKEIDNEVFDAMFRYYNKYGISPDMKMIMDQTDMYSDVEAFQSLMRLINAGCVYNPPKSIRVIPLISPEDARNWCGEDDFCRQECEQKLDLLIIEYACRHNGASPTIEDILRRYKESLLYPVIEEHAIRYICGSYVLTEQIPPRVKLTESHKENLRKALSVMKAGCA